MHIKSDMRQLHIIIYIIAALCWFGTPDAEAAGKSFVVVLDAGHGGKDPGCIGSSRSNREKDIAYNITMEIGRLLKSHSNIKVIYTRKTDVFVELGRRAEIANKAKADLFVSIHVNAIPKNAKHYAYGVQSYTLSLSTTGTNLEVEKRENSVIALEGEAAKKYGYDSSSESNIMFELMQDRDMKESVEFAKMAQYEMIHTGGRKDMGVRQANLAVLRLTYMPSVLLEVGYISTPAEEKFLISRNGQSIMARSIYNAVVKYSNRHMGKSQEPERVSTPTPTPQPAQTIQATTTEPQPVPATTETPVVITETPVATAETPVATAETPTKVQSESKEQVTQTASPTPQFYRVQIMSGGKRLGVNDRQFKGLKVDVHKEGAVYKYTYGAVQTLQEAKQLRKSIADKFPNAFIVRY